MQQISKYFVAGHTAEGYVNFLSSNLVGINSVVVLQHPSNAIKTKVLNELIAIYEQVQPIELICSTRGEKYVDGIIIRPISLAVLSDHLMEKTPQPKAQNIQLDDYITKSSQSEQQTDIKHERTLLEEKSYPHFKASLMIHDQLEKIYINEMNFKEADKIAETFIQSLFKHGKSKKRQSIVYERLFGTNTPDGFVNHLVPLIEPIGKRIFIKGRAGTGKSFFMNKVLTECKLRGLDVELYRCSFDPNSIDMLILRELDICLFDSTPPHELLPSRPTDEVIDFYEKTVTPGTDEKYAAEIEHLTKGYKTEMSLGREKLSAFKLIETSREMAWQNVREEEIQTIVENIIKKK